MPSFLLQKKHRLLFNESNDEGMMSLLEATTTSPCSPVGHPFVAEVDRVRSPDRATGARGTSLTLEVVEEVASMVAAVPAGLSTAAVLPDDRTEAVAPPTLKVAWLESSYGVKRVDAMDIPRLQMAQGPLVVLAPRGLPHSPSGCP